MTVKSDYFILIADDLAPSESEILSAYAFDAGAAGIEEALVFEQSGAEYEPKTIEQDTISLKIYFETAPSAIWLEEMKSKFGSVRFTLLTAPVKDWLEEWKKGYKAFALDENKRIWVVPSWLQVPEEAERAIRIDPGMAFGTGTHETTKLAARLLLSEPARFLTKSSGLDVGTGTGILAMLMALVGFDSVVGNDIDEEARRVARENVRINNFAQIDIVDEDISRINRSFDVVVANIIDGVLIKIQKHLRDRVAPRGHLMMTGILEERAANFYRDFDMTGFEVVEKCQMGEWVGVLLQRVT